MKAAAQAQRAAGFAADDARTIERFEQLARAHPLEARACDWGSAAAQRRRFEVLAGLGELGGSALLDVGCGQGDLWAWLQSAGIECDYLGVDLTPGMLAIARARFGGGAGAAGGAAATRAPRFEREGALELAQRVPRTFDWVLASGLFYLRTHEPEEFLRGALANFARLARRGFALNCLSSWGGAAQAGEWRIEPARLLALGREVCPRVVLRHDYHPGDVTLYAYTEAA